ncbi:MAG: hypothetical protein OXC81_04185 [Betaproteobacteria bacterium]|nr:hypothetical protein [Betaproteobacteria bacterium]
MNRILPGIAAIALALLAGCGFEPAKLAALPAVPIAIESDSAPLRRLAVEQLGERGHDPNAAIRLVLAEQRSEHVAGRGPAGGANLVKISYRLDYRLQASDGSILHESVFRFSENLAHDDSALRASLLSRQRTFELTRKRALRRVLQETALLLDREENLRP